MLYMPFLSLESSFFFLSLPDLSIKLSEKTLGHSIFTRRIFTVNSSKCTQIVKLRLEPTLTCESFTRTQKNPLEDALPPSAIAASEYTQAAFSDTREIMKIRLHHYHFISFITTVVTFLPSATSLSSSATSLNYTRSLSQKSAILFRAELPVVQIK